MRIFFSIFRILPKFWPTFRPKRLSSKRDQIRTQHVFLNYPKLFCLKFLILTDLRAKKSYLRREIVKLQDFISYNDIWPIKSSHSTWQSLCSKHNELLYCNCRLVMASLQNAKEPRTHAISALFRTFIGISKNVSIRDEYPIMSKLGPFFFYCVSE